MIVANRIDSYVPRWRCQFVMFSILALLVVGGCAPSVEPALPVSTEVVATATTEIVITATAVLPTQPPPTPTLSPTITATNLPPTVTPPPTATPIPPATAIPSAISMPEPSPTSMVVAFGGVQLLWDGRIADQIVPMEETWGEMRYTVFKFAPEGLCREVGCIEIYDVAAYEAEKPGFPLPPLGAGIVLSIPSQNISFANGSGARRLRIYGQDGFFANNEALLYEFAGYTADGRFYILATIPLDSSILLSTYDPAQNSNPNAIPVPAELPSDPIELGAIIFDYNREVEPHLAEQPANQFSPNLDLLDALIASLVVEL